MGCNQLCLKLTPIRDIPGILEDCNSYGISHTKCILSDISKLLYSIRRNSGISGIREKDLTICISDPNEITDNNIRHCLGGLLCREDSGTQEQCPDIIICNKKNCVFIEYKTHIKSNKTTQYEDFFEEILEKFQSACESTLRNILQSKNYRVSEGACGKIIYVSINVPNNIIKKYEDEVVIVAKDYGKLIEYIKRCTKG